jgi:hypothetical protein
MRRVILAILISVVALVGGVCPALGQSSSWNYLSFGLDADNHANVYGQYLGFDFTTNISFQLTGVTASYHVDANSTGDTTLTLYEWDGSAPMAPIGDAVANFAPQSNAGIGNQTPANVLFVASTQPTLAPGHYYYLEFVNSGVAIVPYYHNATGGGRYLWTDRNNNLSETDLKVRFFGSWGGDANVETYAARYLPDQQVVIAGMVTRLGQATGAATYFDYGPDTSYGSTVQAQNVNGVMLAGWFDYTLRGVPIGQEYHYRARALISGANFTGDDMTFTYTDNQSLPSVTLVLDSWNGQTAQMRALVNMGTYDSGIAVLEHATVATFNANTDLETATDLVGVEIINYTVSGLSVGQNYLRVTLASGAPSVISNVIQLRGANSSLPPGVDTVEGWFAQWGFGALTWWIIALIFILGGLILSLVIQKGWPLVVMSLAACVMLVVVDTANLWLVGLLALVAALLIVWKLSKAGK